MRIEQYGHSDPGYKPILIREGWQIGHLNFAPELRAEAIDRVERHRRRTKSSSCSRAAPR